MERDSTLHEVTALKDAERHGPSPPGATSASQEHQHARSCPRTDLLVLSPLSVSGERANVSMARRSDRTRPHSAGVRRLGLGLYAGSCPPDRPSSARDVRHRRDSQTHQEPVAQRAVAWMEEHAPEWLPKIERQRGHRTERLFWQSGGGFDRNIVEPGTLLKMIDYLHENPVRKGLVLRGREWKWSSAAWYVDLMPVPLIPDRIPPEWLASTGIIS